MFVVEYTINRKLTQIVQQQNYILNEKSHFPRTSLNTFQICLRLFRFENSIGDKMSTSVKGANTSILGVSDIFTIFELS